MSYQIHEASVTNIVETYQTDGFTSQFAVSHSILIVGRGIPIPVLLIGTIITGRVIESVTIP